ncbi:MAG: pyruvate ferredoxin oxidoreductase [Clostridiales Family XIII bacterium]|jgi:pyruvate ferredoxin oxidoreductase beta subunit|nr:pyruvate ferredoxin oxidoreductase [Clostridiales Family XIII bacterium]
MAYQAYTLKEAAKKPERLAPGHRMCAGCGGTVGIRAVLRALKPEDRAVITCATSCLEVSSMTYPYTSWEDSFIHTAFENAASTTSGVEAAYEAMKKKGKLDGETYKFITFGGDGGTYDIGFQALSGAMERGTDMVYVCYDNEAYMNTGIQRSSSTPLYADTTTSAVGSKSDGKIQFKKDLTKIMAAHHIPYAAQTTYLGNFKDIHQKSEAAIYTEGPAFLNVLAPCPRGWRYNESQLMAVCKAAVETCVWPLFEVIDGEWVLNYEPKTKLPVEEYLKLQGRFKHLFKPGGEQRIAEIQEGVDQRWEELRNLCGV